VSKETVNRITDRVVEEMSDWSVRPLDEVYAAIFIDAIVVKVRDGQVANRPVYAAIGVNLDGRRARAGPGCPHPSHRGRPEACSPQRPAHDYSFMGVTIRYVWLDRKLPEYRLRMTFRLAIVALLTAAVVVGYVVVAIVQDAPEDGSVRGPSWPGQGFVVLAAVGIIGFASLIEALHSGRARRSALRRPEGDQAVPHGGDEQRS
jgi:Transposase, Mutator family